MGIEWNKFSNYLTLEENIDYQLVLNNWRQHEKEYNGRVKSVLSFDVKEINGVKVEYPIVFSCSGGNALAFKNMIENAEKNNRNYIFVAVNRARDKKISIVDMSIVKKIIGGIYGNDS